MVGRGAEKKDERFPAGVALCRILSIEKITLEIESIDARDQTNIKCYIPYQQETGEITVPD